jgi:hypothetical protein
VGPVPGTVSEFDISGFWETEHRDFRACGVELHVIATRELAKAENMELILEFRSSGFGGLSEQALDHRIHDIVKSDSPKREGGISRGFTMGVDFLKGK